MNAEDEELADQVPGGEDAGAQSYVRSRLFFCGGGCLVLGVALLVGSLVSHKDPLLGALAIAAGILILVYEVKSTRDKAAKDR